MMYNVPFMNHRAEKYDKIKISLFQNNSTKKIKSEWAQRIFDSFRIAPPRSTWRNETTHLRPKNKHKNPTKATQNK